MRVEHVPYDETWPAQFGDVAARVRSALGDAVLEIHHIGSTAIPGIAAKDVIDVQVTVAGLDVIDRFRSMLEAQGFILRTDIKRDHLPP